MYKEFYNFSDKPFRLTPDRNIIFSSQEHKRALLYLEYGISLAEGFVVITGDIGTGKTTLIQALLNELNEKQHTVATISSSNLNPEELIAMIAASFGLTHENRGKVQLLKAFEQYLTKAAREERRVLIVVDEAQNLPMESLEELRMLLNIQMAEGSALQILLLGQPELLSRINSKKMMQLKQRVVASYHLRPMSRLETENYILFRLKRVARSSLPLISGDTYDVIHKYAGGVPRLINMLCDRLLLYGYLEGLNAFDKIHVNDVLNEMEQDAIVSGASSVNGDHYPEKIDNNRMVILEEKVDKLRRQLQFACKILVQNVKAKK